MKRKTKKKIIFWNYCLTYAGTRLNGTLKVPYNLIINTFKVDNATQ